MYIIKYFVIFLVSSSLYYLNAQDDESFFPSDVGNTWFYYYWNGGFLTSYSNLITSDSVDEFQNHFLFFNNASDPDYKIETDNNIFQVFTTFHFLLYKLDADIGEPWENPATADRRYAWLSRIDSVYLFSKPTLIKVFRYGPGRPDSANSNCLEERWIAKGFGLIYEWHEPYHWSSLAGCIINGDTSGIVTSLGKSDEILPDNFHLEQNFPNPFNPTTKIKYSIPALTTNNNFKVQLIVYDILGNEIALLVDKQQSSGNYEIEFNADNISSGMYFYQLRFGNMVQTKKMLYIK